MTKTVGKVGNCKKIINKKAPAKFGKGLDIFRKSR